LTGYIVDGWDGRMNLGTKHSQRAKKVIVDKPGRVMMRRLLLGFGLTTRLEGWSGLE
jgi:hypothetical protein